MFQCNPSVKLWVILKAITKRVIILKNKFLFSEYQSMTDSACSILNVMEKAISNEKLSWFCSAETIFVN